MTLEEQIRAQYGGSGTGSGNWDDAGYDRAAELATLLRNAGVTQWGDLSLQDVTRQQLTSQALNPGEYQEQFDDSGLSRGFVDMQGNPLQTSWNADGTQLYKQVMQDATEKQLRIGDQTVGYLGDYNNDGTYGSKASPYLQNGSLLGWSARGDGNTGYNVITDPNTGKLVIAPSWASSSDASKFREAAIAAAALAAAGTGIAGLGGAGPLAGLFGGGGSAAGAAGAGEGAGGLLGGEVGFGGFSGSLTGDIGAQYGLGSLGAESAAGLVAPGAAGSGGALLAAPGASSGFGSLGGFTSQLGNLPGGSAPGAPAAPGAAPAAPGSTLGSVGSGLLDFAKANPQLIGGLLGGALGGLGGSDSGSQAYSGPMPTITRGNWQPQAQAQMMAAPNYGSKPLPTTGNANSGLWRYRGQ